MENPPPEIVSCHLVFHPETVEAPKLDDLEEETSRQQSDRGSSEGSFTMELNSIKKALDKLAKRCMDISRRAKKRHQAKLEDSEESILNRRIEEVRPTKEYLNEIGCPVVIW